MTALATASGGYHATAASSIDRAIRLSTVAAVLAVAAIAAYVSYWHAYAVVRAHGENGITARLEPATIDGLVYASSMVILCAARHRIPVPALARWLLGLGIAATVTANMAQGWSHGPVGAVVAAWPAASLVGSYELSLGVLELLHDVAFERFIERFCNTSSTCVQVVVAAQSPADDGRATYATPLAAVGEVCPSLLPARFAMTPLMSVLHPERTLLAYSVRR